MERIECNVLTGVVSTITLSPGEEAAALATSAAVAAVEASLRAPEQLEADCLGFLNGGSPRIDIRKVIKAHIISCEAFRLGVAPGQLTAPQLLAIRNRVAAIYKAL